jgi:hypothetical protein
MEFMNNIDFSTLCLISVPGFLLGVMTGRLLSKKGWQLMKRRLGFLGKVLSGVTLVAYVVVSLIVLGIMIIYMTNFPETTKPSNFWLTLLFAFWITINLFIELRDLTQRRKVSDSALK